MCCGCRNCVNVCPEKAVSFATDKYGFEFPSVDPDLCKECNLCSVACPALSELFNEKHYKSGIAYALDSKTKYHGSSGGLFGVFAKQTLLDGGIVFGAAFDSHLKLKTSFAENEEDLFPLYKSKYLLCDTADSFVKMQTELEKGRNLLYCSSPCQISALRLFLGKEYKNLLTVDFVCHGVGSQEFFDKSINHLEKQLSAKILSFNFRYKKGNAASHYYYYYYERDGAKFKKSDLYLSFPYYNAYEKQLICRDSCYLCKYAVESRVSDITIGDFHNIRKYDKSIDRLAGVSMFVCNTEKGNEFFEKVSPKMFVKSLEWEELRINNRFSNDNKNIPKSHETFMQAMVSSAFDKVVHDFLRPIKDWKWLIYYKSPKKIRDLLVYIHDKMPLIIGKFIRN